MSPIEIRSARPADLAAITEIYRDAVLHGTATYEIDPPDFDEMVRRFHAITADGFPYVVAEYGGSVFGYAYANYFRTRPAYWWSVEDSIYVAPEAKGRGLGKLLLQRLIKDCTALGFRQLIAVIGDGHEASASVRLHTSAGFSFCGTIRGSGFKHGRWLDTALMQLDMNGGAETLPGKPPLRA
ncbi:GNAT family N-acetyltransferase [Phyllobacterium zundukense]|uniref:GNAT family N-acetyltransferase n=1 Tax=Phyllobacterium zundukense TaxID=1867719 RepID=A0A2N9VXB0_9HYPH|nr:GNAT family N-acetyltransferase [Phyllobacterium zundukense]ATU93987.1 GNAT family N-acetyltransferase [Phyllobacterium zundukense]PIO44128.1 GNAT family N-acetyltransferase [Phyllobacterium zundukense]